MNKKHFGKLPPNIVLWGGTGQAKVVRPIIEFYNSRVVLVIDDTPNMASPFPDVSIVRGYEGFKKWRKEQNSKDVFGFCITIGNPNGRVRVKFAELLKSAGLTPINVIHPSAVIANNARIGEGIQVMAGAIIQPETVIGEQCIINTRASVDHECVLGDGVEIGPGATVCGSVTIESGVWIAAGATILPWLIIEDNAIAGAGAVVTKNIPKNEVWVGVPAKFSRFVK